MSVELENLKPGDDHYKAYIGPPLKYDLVGAMQFNLLTSFGLRDYHKLLDIGCGSLRSGKLSIPYLQKGNYFGIEPNSWLVEEGIKHELGSDLIATKSPTFNNSSDFELQAFGEKFDFIIAQSIFSHTSENQVLKCMKEAKHVLKKDGFFLGTFVLGKDNYTGDEWVYPDCVTFRHSHILKMIRSQCLDAIKTDWHHPNYQTWYVIFHPENRRNAEKMNGELFSRNKMKFNFKKFAERSPLLNNALTQKLYGMIKSK